MEVSVKQLNVVVVVVVIFIMGWPFSGSDASERFSVKYIK